MKTSEANSYFTDEKVAAHCAKQIRDDEVRHTVQSVTVMITRNLFANSA